MDEKELVKKLESEGFRHTYVWEDGPNAFYPDHTHATMTAHIILHGEMTLTMNGRTETFSRGAAMRRSGWRCSFGENGVARLPLSDRRVTTIYSLLTRKKNVGLLRDGV